MKRNFSSTLVTLALLVPGVFAQMQQPAGELLYSRLTGDVWQVWLRDLSTGEDAQITFCEGDKRYPRWTPAGEVYYHTINQEAFAVRLRGDGPAEPGAVLGELWPVRDLAWSPDGRRVAFSRIRTDLIDAANLWLVDEGGAASWLTQDPGIQYNPCWSPNGERIAFVSGSGWGTYEIETMRADGSERRRLTENAHHEFLPAWSPDGRSIAFVSDRSGNYELWVMDPDGANARQLTHHPALDTGPCWSPDGLLLAYTSARSGRVQIWTVPAAGGEPRPLVDVPGGARDPAWRARQLPLALAAKSAANPAPRAIPAQAGSQLPLALSEIGAFPKTLRRDRDRELEVRLRLSHPARVRLDVVDEAGRLCRRLATPRLDAGPHSLRWDGDDAQGEPVPSGVYRYVLVAEDERGRQAVHDPSTEPWGEEIQPSEFTFEEESGQLRWIQPRAGFARLRAAINGFPLLDTLLDWAPLEGGEQVFDWNGLDASGLVPLGWHPARWITLEIFSMPRNAIIVTGGADPPAEAGGAGERGAALYSPLAATGEGARLEARKPRHETREPRLSMEFPSVEELDDEGRPVVSGKVPVRVTIASEDAPSMIDALFEVAFYVDLAFVFEDEESTTPMTWIWDTGELEPGLHLLTVNVFSYDGRIGCLTRPVVVESAR